MFSSLKRVFGQQNEIDELLAQKKLFTAQVDTLLNNTLRIDTNNATNPGFPGILKYYGYIDEVWAGNGTIDDAVARIGCMYFMGLSKSATEPHRDECKELETRLRMYFNLCRENKSVGEHNLNHYLSLIDKYSLKS